MRGLTIVFDLDGTLVDTAPDLVAAANHALADVHLPPIEPHALRPFISLGARHMIVEGLRLSKRVLGEAEIDVLLMRFLAHYEANIARESRPFAGAVAALAHLKAAGARLAVCTNKREGLSRQLLDALAMTHLFDAIAGRDTFAVSKPHRDHLLGTIAMAGGDARQSIMVGDTIVDIETADNAGVPSIAVTFGYSDVPVDKLKPGISIQHFQELTAAVAFLRPHLAAGGGE